MQNDQIKDIPALTWRVCTAAHLAFGKALGIILGNINIINF